MATSRTGTARWKRLRSEALAQAERAGLTRCPCVEDCRHHKGRPCGVRLDYTTGRTPTSAEPDHLRPWGKGGADDLANVRVVCRRCNQARGAKRLRGREVGPPPTTTTLLDW